MEMLATLLQEINSNNFEVGSWMWVDILHINNPHSFYIRPRIYNRYLPLLQAKGERLEPSEIHIGNMYVYESSTLKCVVRGRVVGCNSNGKATYKMYALDFGSTDDNITLERIWSRLYELDVPSLVTHCQLADCAPRGEEWGQHAIDAMRTFVEGERAKMIIRNKTSDILIVELYNSRPDDIATLLALSNLTSFGYVGATASRLQDPYLINKFYDPRPLQIGEKMRVRMLSGLLIEQFFAVPVDEYELYLTDRDNYTHYARSQNEIYMEDLTLNGPVGVYHHRSAKYERGVVKEMYPETNRAKVQLIDLGITIEESVMKMKAIPDWYLRVPTRAVFCTPHSSQKLTNEIGALSYPGMEFNITIMGIGEEQLMRPHVVVVSPLTSK